MTQEGGSTSYGSALCGEMTEGPSRVDAQRTSRPHLRSWLGKVGFGLIVTVVMLMLGDLVMWALVRLPHPYAAGPISPDKYVLDEIRRVPLNRYIPSYHRPMLELEFKLDGKALPGLSESPRFTLNKFGFRSPRLEGVAKPAGVVRVFCVGGSTTECLYLDDQDAWPEVLYGLLPTRVSGLDVINVGRSGDNTRHHLSLLVHRILPFEPDIVIFLIGGNDLGLYMQPDYSPIRAGSRSLIPEPKVDFRVFRVWVQATICDWSQIVRAAVWGKRRLVSSDERGNPVQDRHGLWIEREKRIRRSLPYREIDPTRYPFPEFEQNVRSLIGMCRANGVIPVMLTQPSLAGASLPIEHLLWGHLKTHKIRHEQSWEALERVNEVTRKIAREQGVLLVDLAQRLPKTTEVFYDGGHFNVSGAAKVASEVEAGLMRHPETRERLK